MHVWFLWAQPLRTLERGGNYIRILAVRASLTTERDPMGMTDEERFRFDLSGFLVRP